MIAATKVPCPECGHANPAEARTCRFCGCIRRFRAPRPAEAVAPPHRAVVDVMPACEPHKTTVLYLLAGGGFALTLTFLPILDYVGWFFASLCHETGHCIAAWLAGCPAVPAIRLDGHAAATHLAQSKALCVVIWAGIGALAWHFRDRRRGVWVFGMIALLYPVFAFTSLRELIFLLAGQTGELAFAGVFFWRGLVGGFTQSKAERALYLGCAWYLLASNVALNAGLAFDAAARNGYRENGSFGLTNDFIRAARHLGVSLEAVGFWMLVVSLTVFPLSWWLSRPRRRGVTVTH